MSVTKVLVRHHLKFKIPTVKVQIKVQKGSGIFNSCKGMLTSMMIRGKDGLSERSCAQQNRGWRGKNCYL